MSLYAKNAIKYIALDAIRDIWKNPVGNPSNAAIDTMVLILNASDTIGKLTSKNTKKPCSKILKSLDKLFDDFIAKKVTEEEMFKQMGEIFSEQQSV